MFIHTREQANNHYLRLQRIGVRHAQDEKDRAAAVREMASRTIRSAITCMLVNGRTAKHIIDQGYAQTMVYAVAKDLKR